MDKHQLAAGFFDIANSNMAQAIRQVSISRGRDVRNYTLVVFGGAGGQHACAIARELEIENLLFDQYAGVLSAYGMGLAPVSWHGEAEAGNIPLHTDHWRTICDKFKALDLEGKSELRKQGLPSPKQTTTRTIFLCYQGTDTTIPIPLGNAPNIQHSLRDLRQSFEKEHQQLFGYIRTNRPISIRTLRVHIDVHLYSPPQKDNATYPSALTHPRRKQPMWSNGRFGRG